MGWFFWQRPEIAILAAGAEEVPGMAEIHAVSFPRAWGEDEIAGMLDGPGVHAWVAKPAGRGDQPPCGFLILRQAADEAEVITVAVSPAARRSGGGRALMLVAIRHCRQEGLRRVLLEVSEHNIAAIALYRSLGFSQVGRRTGYYTSHGPATSPSALIMQLDLG